MDDSTGRVTLLDRTRGIGCTGSTFFMPTMCPLLLEDRNAHPAAASDKTPAISGCSAVW